MLQKNSLLKNLTNRQPDKKNKETLGYGTTTIISLNVFSSIETSLLNFLFKLCFLFFPISVVCAKNDDVYQKLVFFYCSEQ